MRDSQRDRGRAGDTSNDLEVLMCIHTSIAAETLYISIENIKAPMSTVQTEHAFWHELRDRCRDGEEKTHQWWWQPGRRQRQYQTWKWHAALAMSVKCNHTGHSLTNLELMM